MSVVADAPVKTPFDPDGRLHFDANTHAYWLDQQQPRMPLLSVTQALQEGLAGTMGEEHWTEEARTRGSYIHQAILYHAEGDLAEDTLHESIAPYFQAYLQFLEDERPEILFVEQRVFDEPLGYAGTFDLLVKLRGRNAWTQHVGQRMEVLDLIDVKTGGLPWWVRLQLAAYKRRVHVAIKNVVVRPWALQLQKRGVYRLEPTFTFPGLRSADAERDFLSVLRTAQLKRFQC